MKVKSPVRSLESAKLQIKAGADELYVGYNITDLGNITFHGRATKSQWDSEPTCPGFDSLKDIISYAHDNGVHVHLTANMPFWPADAETKKRYTQYCENAVNIGIDGLIIGDIGALESISKEKFDVALLTSTFMDCVNIGNVKLLESFGATRILLPNQMHISEMKQITKEFPHLEFEVFGHFGCAHYNGNCFILHGVGKDVKLGLPCRSYYDVKGQGISESSSPIMDAGEDCSICQIPQLKDAGIDILKIVGRSLKPEYVASITRSYRNAVDMFNKNHSIEDVKDKTLRNASWWKSACDDTRCKYANTAVTRAFV